MGQILREKILRKKQKYVQNSKQNILPGSERQSYEDQVRNHRCLWKEDLRPAQLNSAPHHRKLQRGPTVKGYF